MRLAEKRAKRLVLLAALVAAVFTPFLVAGLPASAAGPTINIWYGPNQQFGNQGRPQKWIDILGNVAMPATASFALNGVSKGALSLGPDNLRLENSGDFVAQISTSDPNLVIGSNTVAITASSGGGTSTATVNFTYNTPNWPLPYAVNWPASGIQGGAQVVDGLWQLSGGGVRTQQAGYDRLMAIGEAMGVAWTSYEVTVPITLHAVAGTPSSTLGCKGQLQSSCTPAVGLILRWDGHEMGGPEPRTQPYSEPWPFGQMGVAFWDTAGQHLTFIHSTRQAGYDHISPFSWSPGQTYWFKMRVDGNTYSLKAWLDGTGEPGWAGSVSGDAGILSGSLLLVAHYVDATFGTVTVCPLTGSCNPVPPTTTTTSPTTTQPPVTTTTQPPVALKPPVGMVDPATGQWHLRNASGTVRSFYYGNPGDTPVMGDWNGDGIDTPGMYRRSDGFVYLTNSLPAAGGVGQGEIRFTLGNPGDLPLAGDFDGNNLDTISVYRPSEGRVYISNVIPQNGSFLIASNNYFFGNPGDVPFVADFNGNNTDTVGLYRPTSLLVYYADSHGNPSVPAVTTNSFFFGNPGDRFVAGDWNGNGDETAGVFRPSELRFYFKNTNLTGFAEITLDWGEDGWLPVTGRWPF